jgi:hypothetical protein
VSAQYFIAKTVQANEYVLLMGSKIVGGPYSTAAEADRERQKLVKEGRSIPSPKA